MENETNGLSEAQHKRVELQKWRRHSVELVPLVISIKTNSQQMDALPNECLKQRCVHLKVMFQDLSLTAERYIKHSVLFEERFS